MIEGIVGTGLADDAIQRGVGHDANEDGGDEHVLQPFIDQDFRFWRLHRWEERYEGPNCPEERHDDRGGLAKQRDRQCNGGYVAPANLFDFDLVRFFPLGYELRSGQNGISMVIMIICWSRGRQFARSSKMSAWHNMCRPGSEEIPPPNNNHFYQRCPADTKLSTRFASAIRRCHSWGLRPSGKPPARVPPPTLPNCPPTEESDRVPGT